MPIDYAHCLRQPFTKNILTTLLNGTSVNVVVPKNEEADRLVTDIQGCELANARMLAVNMRFCRGDYQQFLLDLSQQYHQTPTAESSDLSTLLVDLEQAEQRFVIVLNHFDAMGANEVDDQFDQGFYTHLNSLKNYRNVALLLITQGASYHGMLFNIGGEFKTSRLDIQEIEHLPPLTGNEARDEFTRRHPKLSGVHISHLLQQGQHKELGYDYALLDYLSHQLNHSAESWDDMAGFIRQLKDWHKRYKPQSKSHLYYLKKIAEVIKRVLDISKLSSLFRMVYKVLRIIFSDWLIVLIEKISEVKKRKD